MNHGVWFKTFWPLIGSEGSIGANANSLNSSWVLTSRVSSWLTPGSSPTLHLGLSLHTVTLQGHRLSPRLTYRDISEIKLTFPYNNPYRSRGKAKTWKQRFKHVKGNKYYPQSPKAFFFFVKLLSYFFGVQNSYCSTCNLIYSLWRGVFDFVYVCVGSGSGFP